MSTPAVVDELVVTLRFQDEWPARVADLITGLAEWLAAHPSLAQTSPDSIASFLCDSWEEHLADEGVVHLSCGPIVDRGAAGRAEHTLDSAIVIDDLRRTLAGAAFERYGRQNAA